MSNVKEALDALKDAGLSESKIATALRLKPADNPREAARTVRGWKEGKPCSGPAEVALGYMIQGVLDEEMKKVIPEVIVGGDALGEQRHEIVMRLWWPRLMAVVAAEPLTDNAIPIDGGVEWLSVAMWIDEPIGVDPQEILKRTATAFTIYTSDSMDE